MESSSKPSIGSATLQFPKHLRQNQCTEIPTRECDGKNQVFAAARGAEAASRCMKE
jgi:hypothetical protein